MTSTEVTVDRWSRQEPNIEHCYFGFPPLREYLIETAFGAQLAKRHKDNRYWSEDIIVSQYLQQFSIRSVLSICCGFGHVERRIIKQLCNVESCLGLDIADGALETARQRAREEGLDGIISYEVTDLNSYQFKQGKYDLIIANGALHHLKNLEPVILGIRNALRPGGVLYANEHVGASYQDYPVRQLELINAAAYLVPPELRRRHGQPLRLRHRFLNRILRAMMSLTDDGYPIPDPKARPSWGPLNRLGATVLRALRPRTAAGSGTPFHFGVVHDSRKAEFLRSDPSECVSSADIIPAVRRCFQSVRTMGYGGGILTYALDPEFYDRYDGRNPLHRATLATLCTLERHFTATGELGMEHAMLIAEPGVSLVKG